LRPREKRACGFDVSSRDHRFDTFSIDNLSCSIDT
jgi:hypothetical protein